MQIRGRTLIVAALGAILTATLSSIISGHVGPASALSFPKIPAGPASRPGSPVAQGAGTAGGGLRTAPSAAGPSAAGTVPVSESPPTRPGTEPTASPGPPPPHQLDGQPVKLTRRPGREKIDHSHHGLVPSLDGVNHAWPPEAPQTHRCHGARPIASCVEASTVEYLRKHVLVAIVTGREDAFRVEISQCTWLSHVPEENVVVVSDVVPATVMTPHKWVAGALPEGVEERDGDLFSSFVKKGYVRAVRSAGQGYSAAWIVAQFRFPQALTTMAAEFASRPDLRWAFLIDDDTMLSLNNLVRRLRTIDAADEARRARGEQSLPPWYLSRKGWGGAGHGFSRSAMDRVRDGMHECVDKWMVRQFRASDAMLLKCAGHLKLKAQLEGTMSHCPASHLREGRMTDPGLATLHAKKDMYPPVLLATWRSALYYRASLCRSEEAARLAVEYSACAYGSCKSAHCSKADDVKRMEKWRALSANGTIKTLPLPAFPPTGTPG